MNLEQRIRKVRTGNNRRLEGGSGCCGGDCVRDGSGILFSGAGVLFYWRVCSPEKRYSGQPDPSLAGL